jgi:hypothetical protein
MPNWCINTLSIDGAASAITKFREWLNGEPLTLQKIRPMPQELEETTSPVPEAQADKSKELIEKYGSDNWYDWHVKFWGTKWDIEASEDTASDNNIYYSFDSAWGPSLEATKYLSTLFPELSFTHKYYECGVGFAGSLTISGEDYDEVSYDCEDEDEKVLYRQFVIDEFDFDPFEHLEEEDEE